MKVPEIQNHDREPRIYVPKAPSGWRRGDSSDSLSKLEPKERRYQVENPHDSDHKPVRARSSTINRVIYPDWWCESDEKNKKCKKESKRLKSADPVRAAVYKHIKRHCEDSLDKRLREVQEGF